MGDRASADSLRWNPDLILDQRVADMVELPGGASGLLCRDYKGKNAARLVTRIDPSVVSLVAELRAHGSSTICVLLSGLGNRRSRHPLRIQQFQALTGKFGDS
jgi:hypothetical protein